MAVCDVHCQMCGSTTGCNCVYPGAIWYYQDSTTAPLPKYCTITTSGNNSAIFSSFSADSTFYKRVCEACEENELQFGEKSICKECKKAIKAMRAIVTDDDPE